VTAAGAAGAGAVSLVGVLLFDGVLLTLLLSL